MGTRLIKFKAAANPNNEPIDIAHGHIRKTFAPAAQPFEVTDTEWQALRGNGLFEIDEHAEAAAKKAEEDAAKKAAKKSEEK